MKKITIYQYSVLLIAPIFLIASPLPLVVNESTPPVFMIGYAAWWGDASNTNDGYTWSSYYAQQGDRTFKANEEQTRLSSGQSPWNGKTPYNVVNDMPAYNPSQGYYSWNENAIAHHLNKISEMGVQVIEIDLTNNELTLFTAAKLNDPINSVTTPIPNPGQFNNYPNFSTHIRSLRTLYKKVNELNVANQSNVKIVPVLGYQARYWGPSGPAAATSNDALIDSNFKRGLQEVAVLQSTYTAVNVIFKGKPLVGVYTGPYLNSWKYTQATPVGNQQWTIGHGRVVQSLNLANQQFPGNVPMTLRPYGAHRAYATGELQIPNQSIDDRSDNDYIYSRAYDSNPISDGVTPLNMPLWSWAEVFYARDSDTYQSFAPAAPGATRPEFVVTDRIDRESDMTASNGGGENMYRMLSFALKKNFQFIHIPHWNFFVGHDCGYITQSQRDFEPSYLFGSTAFDEGKTAIQRFWNAYYGGGEQRIIEIRGRSTYELGDAVAQLGFSVNSGGSPARLQRLLVKGDGPTLANFLSGPVVSDPSIRLHWRGGSNDIGFTEDYASPSAIYPLWSFDNRRQMLPTQGNYGTYAFNRTNYGQTVNSKEAGMWALASEGGYTVLLRGKTDDQGKIGHMRVVLFDQLSSSTVTNASYRGKTGTGENTLILSFVPNKNCYLMVRGLGQSLGHFGISGHIQDSKISIFNGSTGQYVAQNISSWTSITAPSGAPQYNSTYFDNHYMNWFGSYGAYTSDAGAVIALTADQRYDIHINPEGTQVNGVGMVNLDLLP